ncbi:MobQ family relaxase [Kineothrix sp. MB12-C1]|uniref:MobQ family relaxase n=1 Tax=Kineothrix sp. MB12-C1 TaxID=3070215 RepID=UPI0027D2F675|nr:MobQ family relaxase [Kineothrix sp. MB12-C1]WMC91321.1 MobQ family relaxase [Kineothrix sp. MB12-C1]
MYSFTIKPISRLNGGSALKVAAYQNRGKLFDEREKTIYDFTHKTDLLYTNIFLPENAPLEFFDSQILWNEAEKMEKRYDARTGRAVIAALPNELTLEEQINLVEKFVTEAFIKYGMCADIAIHSGHRENELSANRHLDQVLPNNPHVHILLADRPVDRDGFCPKKNRDWNKKVLVRQWRKLWAEIQNREFEYKKLKVRVSHESLEVQQINREPTIHLGRKVMEMERRGKDTERRKINRNIEKQNKERQELERQYQLERTQEYEFKRSR